MDERQKTIDSLIYMISELSQEELDKVCVFVVNLIAEEKGIESKIGT